jgi:hypothetical protein
MLSLVLERSLLKQIHTQVMYEEFVKFIHKFVVTCTSNKSVIISLEAYGLHSLFVQLS